MPDQRAGCVFCQRVDNHEYDQKLSAMGLIAVFEPLNPVVPGHLLVVPRQHVRDAAEDPEVTGNVMSWAAFTVQQLGIQANIITSIGPDATQSVFHLHVHIVPRRPDDGLALPWTGQEEKLATPPFFYQDVVQSLVTDATGVIVRSGRGTGGWYFNVIWDWNSMLEEDVPEKDLKLVRRANGT
jgi:histidine triad (HIT) family protein